MEFPNLKIASPSPLETVLQTKDSRLWTEWQLVISKSLIEIGNVNPVFPYGPIIQRKWLALDQASVATQFAGKANVRPN